MNIDPSKIIFKCEDRYDEGITDGFMAATLIFACVIFMLGILFSSYYSYKAQQLVLINNEQIKYILQNTRVLTFEIDLDEETKEDNPSHLHQE